MGSGEARARLWSPVYSATCAHTGKRACSSTRSKSQSCSAGRKAPRKVPNSQCQRRSKHARRTHSRQSEQTVHRTRSPAHQRRLAPVHPERLSAESQAYTVRALRATIAWLVKVWVSSERPAERLHSKVGRVRSLLQGSNNLTNKAVARRRTQVEMGLFRRKPFLSQKAVVRRFALIPSMATTA